MYVLSRVSIDGSRWYQQAALAAGGVCVFCVCMCVRACDRASFNSYFPCTFDSQVDYTLCSNRKGGKKSGRTQNGIRRLLIGPDSFIVNSFQFIKLNPC